jgi:hypothetical protein
LIGQNCVESGQKIVEISNGGKKSIGDGDIGFIIALSLMVRHATIFDREKGPRSSSDVTFVKEDDNSVVIDNMLVFVVPVFA